jgi:hypothetical protein
MRRSSGWHARTTPAGGEPHWTASFLELRKGLIARESETRGLLRLPVRVERPSNVFNLSGLSVVSGPRASHLIERQTRKRSVCTDMR